MIKMSEMNKEEVILLIDIWARAGGRPCSKCGKAYKKDSFTYHMTPNGIQQLSWCKECNSNYIKANLKRIMSNRKLKNREDVHQNDRRYHWAKKGKKLGLKPGELYEKIKAHDKLCEVCGIFMGESFCIDHDHSTGKFRGLICFSCNVSLGHFKDNIDTLKLAILYLERFKNVPNSSQ